MITINSGGVLNNHLSDMASGGGGRITVNHGGTLNADSQSEGVALDLQDSQLVNNGTITGTTNVYYLATVSGSGTFRPDQRVSGGTLAVATASAPQSVGIVGNQGEILGSGTLASPVLVNAVEVGVTNAADVLTLSGVLSGNGTLTKTGNATAVSAARPTRSTARPRSRTAR